MSYLPEDDKARKMLPIFKYITRYCPKAIREVTKVSVVNNVRYNPDKDPADINWARGKSADQLGSLFRHLMERVVDGKVFEDVPQEAAKATGITKVYVLAEAMWRIAAELELEVEREEAKLAVPETSPMTDMLAKSDAASVKNRSPWGGKPESEHRSMLDLTEASSH